MAGAPDVSARLEIFRIHTKSMPLSPDVDLDALAASADGYAGADIESVCREAAIIALRENMQASVITMAHFKAALDKVRPSITKEVEDLYKSLKDQFKTAHAKKMKEDRPSYFM